MSTYKTLHEYGMDEIIIEKSTFIGYAKPIKSEEEAQSILDKLNADFIQQVFLWLQQHKGTVRLAAFLFFMVGIVGMMISYKVSVRAFRKAVEVLE